MKYIQRIKNYFKIRYLCEDLGLYNYVVNSDGSIDINGDVLITRRGLDKLPIKFRNVKGDFICQYTLKTLEGSPRKVGGGFYCNMGKLTSLVGGPELVVGDFYCSKNELTTLIGSPKSVGGNFACYDNELKTLEGGPEFIGGRILCSDNNLINFKGIPDDWRDDCDFSSNPVYKILAPIPNEKRNQFIHMCNDNDVIGDDGVIIEERLEWVYEELGLINEFKFRKLFQGF